MVLDATVPGWWFTAEDREAAVAQYRGWFNVPGTFEELERCPLDGGEASAPHGG